MSTRPDFRLHLFFASQASTAAILLRIRSRQFRLILWNRDDDSFVDGQWINRQIYVDQCRLSPDGRYFLYVGYDGRLQSEAGDFFTAISEPPYFTAHALFPDHYSWSAGGEFIGSHLYWIAGDDRAKNILDDPPGLQRIIRGRVTKDCRTGLRLKNGKAAPLTKTLRESLLAPDAQGSRSTDLDLYDTMNGCLWRRQSGDLSLIRDFRGMEFEPIKAPYDTRPETEEAADGPTWHPLRAEARE